MRRREALEAGWRLVGFGVVILRQAGSSPTLHYSTVQYTTLAPTSAGPWFVPHSSSSVEQLIAPLCRRSHRRLCAVLLECGHRPVLDSGLVVMSTGSAVSVLPVPAAVAASISRGRWLCALSSVMLVHAALQAMQCSTHIHTHTHTYIHTAHSCVVMRSLLCHVSLIAHVCCCSYCCCVLCVFWLHQSRDTCAPVMRTACHCHSMSGGCVTYSTADPQQPRGTLLITSPAALLVQLDLFLPLIAHCCVRLCYYYLLLV